MEASRGDEEHGETIEGWGCRRSDHRAPEVLESRGIYILSPSETSDLSSWICALASWILNRSAKGESLADR